MNAHNQLERQLRASVAQTTQRTPAIWLGLSSRGLSVLFVAAATAVAVGIVVIALVALRRGHSPSSHTVAPATTRHHSRLGPRPKNPGPIPRNVDDAAIAAAWNTAWGRDPACRPPAGAALVSFDVAMHSPSHRRPSATMLSTIPALRLPATAADRLPFRFPAGGRLAPLFSGHVYIRYIRRARVADGTTFYLIPATKLGRPLPPAAANRCYQLTVAALRAELGAVTPAKRIPTLNYGLAQFALGRYNLESRHVHEGVFLFANHGTGHGGWVHGGQSPTTIRQTGMLGAGGLGTPFSPSVMDGIAPAGVATVTLQFPASRDGSQRLPPLNATGDVINNVFVIPIPTLFQRGGWPTTAIWRSSSGQLIKTVDERSLRP